MKPNLLGISLLALSILALIIQRTLVSRQRSDRNVIPAKIPKKETSGPVRRTRNWRWF
jgi:hypothetical protein